MYASYPTRSRYPLSQAIGSMSFSNPFIRNLVLYAKNIGPNASETEKLRALGEFRTALQDAVLEKEKNEHKRKLTDDDCRQLVLQVLGQQQRQITAEQLENAVYALTDKLERAKESTELNAIQAENKKLKAAEQARVDKEAQATQQQGAMHSGGSETSLRQALNNKVSFDPEMAFGRAMMEVMLLFFVEALVYIAIEYRNKRPETVSDVLEVILKTLQSMGSRLGQITLGDDGGMQASEQQIMGAQAAAAAAARPRPAPAAGG